MSAAAEPRDLRSRRYVTSGYANVFHRAFLYGLGLSQEDMKQPFAGLALAHSEAVPGHALVRAVGDGAKRALSSARITEREFVVPESLLSSAAGVAGVTARELVADSAELVVRGHWYDALVGVAATVPAVTGMAQAVARLRIPGIVLVPDERRGLDQALDETVAALTTLGLAAWVTLDDFAGLCDIMVGLRGQVFGTAAVTEAGDVFRAGGVTVEESTWSEVAPHLAAVAHELGISDLTGLLGAASASRGPIPVAELAGIVHPGGVRGPLDYDQL